MESTIAAWYKKIILIIAITGFYGAKISTTVRAIETTAQSKYKVFSSTPESLNYRQWLAQRLLNCRDLRRNYQTIYHFETENHQISICRAGDNYYYHRQSKLNPKSKLLITAQPVFGGSIFRADKGRTVYFVGQNSEGYYSSVMHNSNEMVFEPEIVPSSSVFAQGIIHNEVDLFFSNLRLKNFALTNYQDKPLATSLDKSSQNISSGCIQERSALFSHLEDWYNLLGKSITAANRYALDQGHAFIYDRQTPEQALIKTKEGTTLNLGITTQSETIEEICFQSTEDI